MHSYYVDKTSGTSADTLLAIGFAKLIEQVLHQLNRLSDAAELFVADQGAYYAINLLNPISQEEIKQVAPFRLIKHLDTEKQAKALGTSYGQGFDYDKQRQIRDSYQEQRRLLPAKARSANAYLLNDPDLAALHARIEQPDPLLPTYLLINQMKSGPSFNEPIVRWHSLSEEHLQIHIQALLDCFASSPNLIASLQQHLKTLEKTHKLGKPEMTMLQVINPTAGKGAIRPKGDAITMGNPESLWVLELLKFVGLLELAHPQTIRGSKDRKTYILRPKYLKMSELKPHMDLFRRVHWSNSPARIDILAILQFVRVLLTHDRNALAQEVDILPWEDAPKPADRFDGFDVGFYKDMGSAFAVMNVASLNIPHWIQAPTDVASANKMLEILEEHAKVVESIKSSDGEERTEEYELLRRYRDFISGNDIAAFLDFAALFGPYISQKVERGQPIRRFSVESLKELFTMAAQNSYQTIIENPGFQHLADAIRRSTVTLQFAKGRKARVDFEIRYGLAHDIVRSANNADNFIATLHEFVASYNKETAQKYEVSKGAITRKRISEDDLRSFISLLDQGYSAKTLARMLVAFGSAKTSKEAQLEDKSDNTPSDNEADIVDSNDE